MIAPMKKFLMVILDRDVETAPLHVRKLGIAHIENFESIGESCAVLEHELKSAQAAKNILASSMSKKSAAKDRPAASYTTAADVIKKVLDLHGAISLSRDVIAERNKERERIQDWGDFDPEVAESLARAGIELRFAESRSSKIVQLDTSDDYIRLGSSKGKTRFALINASTIPEGFEEFRIPSLALSSIVADIRRQEKLVEESMRMLSSYSELLPKIEKEIERLEGALTIEKLKAGMPQDGQLRYFYGFVPASAEEKLKKEAKLRGWALALDEPGDEDQPPTKVENNSLVRIIQPVFDFLGTVPGYREYDISKYFLIFFSLYFAMIFGDGGYGILMLLAAIVSIVANKKKAKPIPDFLKLVVVLSITTILWGLATGTWFALSFESLPGIMQSLAITAFAANNPDSGTNIKIFCFVIGVLQLSLAHIKNIKRDFPNPRFIAQLGSLALVIGMFNAVLNLVIDAERFPLQGWSLALIGSGFFLVLAFGNWTGKILSSLLEGLKGIIPTFLGTVSVFADIVSYIRLWAVALAGLAISQTLNGMVVKILGEPGGRIGSFIIGFFFSMVLLVVGHSLNFVMSVLSVVVHGIRLNMLEFSSHLGMEWTGYPYAPLKEQSGDNEDIGESR